MSTYTRARTRRQRFHSASRSRSSQLDKRTGEARKAITFLAIPKAPSPSPVRDFSPWLTGHEYAFRDGGWRRCIGPEDYGKHLESEANRRDWFSDVTTRHGAPVRMRRRSATPIEIVTVTFPPWLSAWTLSEFTRGRDPRRKLAEIRNASARKASAHFAGIRHLVGVAVHTNTSDIHVDYAVSRQDGLGGRIGGAGLRLVGPWAVGTDRQVRAGAVISPEKRRQLTRSAERYRQRYGTDSQPPLDIVLARELDIEASRIIGEDLTPFIRDYARQVPSMEEAHQLARLAALDAARGDLAPKAATPPSSSKSTSAPELLP